MQNISLSLLSRFSVQHIRSKVLYKITSACARVFGIHSLLYIMVFGKKKHSRLIKKMCTKGEHSD